MIDEQQSRDVRRIAELTAELNEARAALAAVHALCDASEARPFTNLTLGVEQVRAAAGVPEPPRREHRGAVARHGDHAFEPGVDLDMTAEGRSPDPTWCNVCGERR